MAAMAKGQVWLSTRSGLGGPVEYRVLHVSEDGKEASILNADKGPVFKVEVEAFTQKHRLITEADGKQVPPPAPEPFKVGDVVRLKCGGPQMVVVNFGRAINVSSATSLARQTIYDDDGTVRCAWHLADGALAYDNIPIAILTPAESLAYHDVDFRTAVTEQFP